MIEQPLAIEITDITSNSPHVRFMACFPKACAEPIIREEVSVGPVVTIEKTPPASNWGRCGSPRRHTGPMLSGLKA